MNFKYSLGATIIAAAMTLGACATNPTTGLPTIDVAQVQQDAVAVCSFLPTASTVAGIIAAGNPILATAEAVAAAICAAVAPKPAASLSRKVEAPEVNGVLIKGTFVH